MLCKNTCSFAIQMGRTVCKASLIKAYADLGGGWREGEGEVGRVFGDFSQLSGAC